jgi:hypothetical protein
MQRRERRSRRWIADVSAVFSLGLELCPVIFFVTFGYVRLNSYCWYRHSSVIIMLLFVNFAPVRGVYFYPTNYFASVLFDGFLEILCSSDNNVPEIYYWGSFDYDDLCDGAPIICYWRFFDYDGLCDGADIVGNLYFSVCLGIWVLTQATQELAFMDDVYALVQQSLIDWLSYLKISIPTWAFNFRVSLYASCIALGGFADNGIFNGYNK